MTTDKLGSYGAARREVTRESRALPAPLSRGKLARFHSQTRAGDARFSIMERTSKIRRNLLRRPQSFRSHSITSLRIRHPSASPLGDGGVEIRHMCSRVKSAARDYSRPVRVRLLHSFASPVKNQSLAFKTEGPTTLHALHCTGTDKDVQDARVGKPRSHHDFPLAIASLIALLKLDTGLFDGEWMAAMANSRRRSKRQQPTSERQPDTVADSCATHVT